MRELRAVRPTQVDLLHSSLLQSETVSFQTRWGWQARAMPRLSFRTAVRLEKLKTLENRAL